MDFLKPPNHRNIRCLINIIRGQKWSIPIRQFGTQITSSSQTKPVSAASINTSPKTLIVTTTAADTTTRSAESIPSLTTKPAITATTTVNTPTTITRIVPVQQAPPAPANMDTRLGSSTPQYDTWKKNANGAGAVTTSPK